MLLPPSSGQQEWQQPPCGLGSCFSSPGGGEEHWRLQWQHLVGPQPQPGRESQFPQPTASSRMTLVTSVILLRFIFAQRDETTMRRNALRALKGIQGRERRPMQPVSHTPNATIQLQVGTGSNVTTFRNHSGVFLQKGLVCVYAPGLWALARFTLSYA